MVEENPSSETNDELLAPASIVKPLPFLTLVEGAPTNTVGPTDEERQAELAEGTSTGFLAKWIIGLSLAVLMVTDVLLLLSVANGRKTQRTRLPPPTIGPALRLGPLPLFVSLLDQNVLSKAKTGSQVKTSQ